MPTKGKTYSHKTTSGGRIFFIVFIILFLLAFLLRFEAPAKALASVTPWTTEQIQNFAGHVALVSLGLILVKVGLTFSAVPFVGIGLAVIGSALLIYEAIRIWNETSKSKIKGVPTSIT